MRGTVGEKVLQNYVSKLVPLRSTLHRPPYDYAAITASLHITSDIYILSHKINTSTLLTASYQYQSQYR